MENFANILSPTPDILDSKHGSAAVSKKQKVDVAEGSPRSAMASGSTALGVSHADVLASDDSLIMSPISENEEKKKKGRSRSPTPTRASSTYKDRFWSPSPRAASTKVKRLVSAPRGRRPAPRPPSPAAPLQLADHHIFVDGQGDINERVEKLERQRVADHHFLAQIASSIQTLEKHFGAAHSRLT